MATYAGAEATYLFHQSEAESMSLVAGFVCLCGSPEVEEPDAPSVPVLDSYSRSTFRFLNPLGAGLVRPFRRTERSDFLNADGVPEVLSNIGQVLGTVRGSIPWRPEFGSDLHQLRHRALGPGLREIASRYASDAVRIWEPRANVVDVQVESAPTDNTLTIRVFTRIGGDQSSVRTVEVVI